MACNMYRFDVTFLAGIMMSQWKAFRLVNACLIAANISALTNQNVDYKTVELEL